MTLKLTLALVMAFITAVIVGKFYVPWLRKMKAGQEIKETARHGTCQSQERRLWAASSS